MKNHDLDWTLQQLQQTETDSPKPFLDLARIHGGNPEDQKFGFGPRWRTEDERKLAEKCERDLLRQYVNAYVRSRLYLRLYQKQPRIPHPAEGGTFILGHNLRESLGYPTLSYPCVFDDRPLRATSEGKLIDPLIIDPRGYALINPQWLNAAVEYGFWLAPGVQVSLCGSVQRERVSREGFMHSKYRILLKASLPSNDLEILKWTR